MTDQLSGLGTSIQPLLVVRDAAAAIDFYASVFGATELWRLMHYHRIGHAVLRVGTSEFVILDEFPEAGIIGPPAGETDTPAPRGPRLMLQVPDVDVVLSNALAAGATLVRPAADQWWGVRSGVIRDPFGYQWSVHSIVESISIEEMQRRADTLGLYPPPDTATFAKNRR
jgi:PhnB protein